MRIFETIADRRIREAKQAGLFDDLPGAGKPIADIDRTRQPGWWALRLVRHERSTLKSEDLKRELALAMPSLWRLDSAEAVRLRVDELNKLIDEYNKVTTLERRQTLDPTIVVDRWRVVRRRVSDS